METQTFSEGHKGVCVGLDSRCSIDAVDKGVGKWITYVKLILYNNKKKGEFVCK